MNKNNLAYKYSSWDDFCIDAVSNRYFWFSKPINFNDPFDCNMDILKHCETTNKVLNHNDENLTYPQNNPFIYIKKQTDNFGVLCLTSPLPEGNIGDKGYNNNHFWAHYANNHKGIALGFDVAKIKDYYTDLLQCKASLLPVNYGKGALDIENHEFVLEKTNTWIKTQRVNGIFGPYANDKDIELFFEQLLLYKDERVWGNENESRIILGGRALAILNNDGKNIFPNVSYDLIYDSGYRMPYPEDVLKEVTFGVRFNTSEINCAICKIKRQHLNVKFYKAELDLKNADVIRKEIKTI